jgi:hypothetical protein
MSAPASPALHVATTAAGVPLYLTAEHAVEDAERRGWSVHWDADGATATYPDGDSVALSIVYTRRPSIAGRLATRALYRWGTR